MSKPMEKDRVREFYPLICKVFGPESENWVEQVTEFGKDNAHMIFAPLIEKALKDMARGKLWDQFLIEVSVKKRRKQKSPSHDNTRKG